MPKTPVSESSSKDNGGTFTLTMKKTKETPGTVVYAADTDDMPKIRTLYLTRGAMKPMPEAITVVVTAVGG